MTRYHFSTLALMLSLTVGCGETSTGNDSSVGDDAALDAPADDSSTVADSSPPGDSALDDSARPDSSGGPEVRIHLRATTVAVPHDPATSGQTPRGWVSGVRSLMLFRTMDDPEPLLVFDHGDGYIEASYDHGADTIVGRATLADLDAGLFTIARTVHTHTRFVVDATVHAGLGPVPGTFEDLVVLCDRTTIDGVLRDRGFFRYVFHVGGSMFPLEGTGFEPPLVSSGGFTVAVEDGETAYYYPALIDVDPTVEEDIDLIFEVNVHEGFRWVDQTAPDFEDGVFDTTTTTTEPIRQVGANSYTYFVE